MTITTRPGNTILNFSLRSPAPGKTIYYDFIELERSYEDLP